GALPIWASPIGRSPSGSGSLRRRSRTTSPPYSPRWASIAGPRSPPGWRATAVAAGANTETEPPVTDTTRLRTAVEELLPTALEELATLVSMRSVADPEVEDPAELDKAANWVAAALGELGLETELARPPDGTDAVLARHTAAPGLPRVLLYAHYDVQPASAAGWHTDPWILTESGGRYYGRGAADCKGNIMAHLTALRALKQVDGEFPCSITV